VGGAPGGGRPQGALLPGGGQGAGPGGPGRGLPAAGDAPGGGLGGRRGGGGGLLPGQPLWWLTCMRLGTLGRLPQRGRAAGACAELQTPRLGTATHLLLPHHHRHHRRTPSCRRRWPARRSTCRGAWRAAIWRPRSAQSGSALCGTARRGAGWQCPLQHGGRAGGLQLKLQPPRCRLPAAAAPPCACATSCTAAARAAAC
jgi:hypothetical protein